MKKQLHAGKYPKEGSGELGKAVFYTSSKGLWRSGFMFDDLTQEELLKICRSVEADLLRHYPDLE
jgi:hypothetical protein